MPTSVADRAFFVTGGTIPAESASYVERSADRDLLNHLLAGRFCYVLNSRQMGKSSLCVRTMKRLDAEGVRTAFVDLTRIGGKNVTPEQWYAGIAVEIGRSLGLRAEILENWKQNAHLSPLQRLFASLREVVLERNAGPVAIFFDEIDATRSLPFSADEFFAGIRECYNRRVQDKTYERLTFCLLGVAVPSDLINSPTSTPFNIGERIYLRDFSRSEAMALASGLDADNPAALVGRVYHWTNGHPYLTQSLCAAIASDKGIRSPEAIDDLVRRDLFDPKARETNINLADVGNRSLHAGDMEPDPEKFRADLLSAYEKAWCGKPLADDESNRVAALLKLSGIMRSEGNRLYVRNRIYRQVFDKAWIRDNMPGQELRRQRRAFWLGVARTTAIAVAVVGTIGWLAWNNSRLAKLAEARRRLAEYRLYVSDVNLMQTAYEHADLVLLDRLLRDTAASPYRNFEWRYWYAQLNDTPRHVDFPKGITMLSVSHDGKSFAVTDPTTQSGVVYSLPDPRVLAGPEPAVRTEHRNEYLVENAGRWVVADQATADRITLRKIGNSVPFGGFVSRKGGINTVAYSPDTNSFASLCQDSAALKPHLLVWDARNFRLVDDISFEKPIGFSSCATSNGARVVAWTTAYRENRIPTTVFDRVRRKVLDQVPGPETNNSYASLSLTPDGRYLAIGYPGGQLLVRDVAARRTVFETSTVADPLILVVISADGRRLLAYGADLVARVWDVANGRLLDSKKGAMEAGLTPDGRWLVVGGDGTRIYPVSEKPRPPGAAAHLTLRGYNALGLVANGPNGIVMLSFNDPTKVVRQGPSVRGIDSISHGWGSPDGKFALRQFPDGRVVIRSLLNGRILCTLPVGTAGYLDIAKDARHLATIQSFKEILAYDSNGKQLWRANLPVECYFCRWSPDASVVAAGATNGEVLLFDGATGHLTRTLAQNTASIYSLAFSHDGTRLAAGDFNRTIVIYDLRGTSPPVEAAAHTELILHLDFSPDDSRLVSGSFDGTVRVWDPQTGEQMLRLGDGKDLIWEVFFNAAGDRIYAGDQAGRILRFDAPAVPATAR